MIQITSYHLFFNKTLKIDVTLTIKMDMSQFEFIFSIEKKSKNSDLNPISLSCQH